MKNTILEKVYVVKYALTKGIEEYTNVELSCLNDTNMIIVRANKEEGRFLDAYYHKGDWFFTKEEAVAKAETFRDNKIQACKKQISKLEKLVF
jgi:hypothetical protein